MADPNDAARRKAMEELQPQYEWRLRELMAVRKNWYTTTKLVPALRERGFEFDRSYIFRLVKADQPPKVAIGLLVALCQILECTFEELVAPITPEEPAAPEPGPVTRLRPVLPDTPMLSPDFFDAES
ncbi:helix-turn-helix transcriptional regulator [Streptomyces sp. NPDC096323]|uniref:helix-turn-helix domain-containing protein n=1 Tax=Streptomyces sp. NPDC096323 TaxID=3155822 RepID=UPI00332BE03F